MLIYLFFISSMYLAIGFAVGWTIVRVPKLDNEHESSSTKETTHHSESNDAPENSEIVYKVEELPAQWVEQLEQVETCRSFVEATTQILTLEVGKYRDSLVDLDSRIRKFINEYSEPETIIQDSNASSDSEKIESANSEAPVNGEATANEQKTEEHKQAEESKPTDEATQAVESTPAAEPISENAKKILQIKQELLQINQTWLNRQSEANDVLVSKQGGIGSHEEMASQLQHVVTSQMAQVETSASNIAHFAQDMPPLECAQRLTLELGVMLKLTHKLRDLIQETMANILQSENRLSSCDPQTLYDSWTGLHNLAGWDSVQKAWEAENTGKEKSMSYILFDIDGFHKMNSQLGIRPCDHLIASIGKFIGGLLRKKSEHEVIARVAGQRFLVTLVDAETKGAMSAAERIRQTIERQEFELQQNKIKMTVTCAVTNLRPEDNDNSLIKRLTGCLDLGKEAHRNCTVVDQGTGPEIIEAMDLDLDNLNKRIDDFIQEDANAPSLQTSSSAS